jgi:hypothetical protein
MSTRAFTFASILLFPALATAAPFCVVTGSGTNCWYYDAQSCRQAAGTAGACVVNPNEMQTQRSSPQGRGFANSRPGIELFNANVERADRARSQEERDFAARYEFEQRMKREQRAADQESELRQLEIEKLRRDLAR